MSNDWQDVRAEWQRAVIGILEDYKRRWSWNVDRCGYTSDEGRESAEATAAFRAAAKLLMEQS